METFEETSRITNVSATMFPSLPRASYLTGTRTAASLIRSFDFDQSEETMVSHWLIDSSSSALSSQHPQTFRFFFPRQVKNINHDRSFPQGLERSNPHENYPHTRETC